MHDLNNPLAILAGFTQLLMANSDCGGKIRSDVEKLHLETRTYHRGCRIDCATFLVSLREWGDTPG